MPVGVLSCSMRALKLALLFGNTEPTDDADTGDTGVGTLFKHSHLKVCRVEVNGGFVIPVGDVSGE